MLSVLKSRGMAHSNQVREFLLTDRGIELADVYVGPQGVLTGSARSAQEAKEHSDAVERQEELQQRRSNLERQRQAVEAQVAVLWREFEDESKAVNRLLSRGATGREEGVEQRLEQGRLRSSDLPLRPSAEPRDRRPAGSTAMTAVNPTRPEVASRSPSSGTCGCTSPDSHPSRCGRSRT